MNATEDRTKRTVLLADDSRTVRQTVRRHLESDGYEVITASDGFEAIASIVEHRPALVLLDVMMPRLDGYQVCALIRNNPELRRTPIILLSGHDDVSDATSDGVAQADDYLAKPFTRERLLSLLDRHVSKDASRTDRAQVAASERARSDDSRREPSSALSRSSRVDEATETSDA